MSATNLTKNLKLPQFLASDKPSWLGDVNGAMLNIDNGYGTLTGDIANANDTASSAKSQSDANTQTLVNVNSELESQGNRITALEAGGGTEQLEQRVNNLSTDVESLQTRADTFEEEIAENGTNITNLTGRVTTVEGKVKTNEDNITSLQTTTDGLTLTTQQIGATANDASSTATKANNTANSANTLASNAYNQSQQNKSAISDINNKLNKKTSINFSVNTYNYSTSISNTHGTPLLAIADTENNTIAFVLTIFSSSTITTTSTFLGSYDMSGLIPNVANMTFVGNPITFDVSGHSLEVSASKEINSNNIDFYIKAVSTNVTSQFNTAVSLSGSFI